jgi:hypothetical protein
LRKRALTAFKSGILDYCDNRTDYDDILLVDAKTYCSIRRISVEGKRHARFPIDERKRPPGILERATPPFGYNLIEAPRSAAQKSKPIRLKPKRCGSFSSHLFGGGCFASHGVNIQGSGTARFTVNSYGVP